MHAEPPDLLTKIKLEPWSPLDATTSHGVARAIVVADGFLGPGKLRGPQKQVCRRLCDCWAIHTLGEVGPFLAALERLGFHDILAEKIQARVTPSFLHVPWVTFKFLLMSVVLGKRKMTLARWNNVLAPILLPLVGFPFGPMAYYIISATRG